MEVEPADHFVNWQQDAFGNFLARLVFPNPTRSLTITVGLIADLKVVNLFDFFIEDFAETFLPAYPKGLREDPPSTCGRWTRGGRLRARRATAILGARPPHQPGNSHHRLPGGPQSGRQRRGGLQRPDGTRCADPDHTLRTRIGSCRDSAWLLVSILRELGLAARFVSGYLVQLTSDVEALDGRRGRPRISQICMPGPRSTSPGGMDRPGPDIGSVRGRGSHPIGSHPHPSSAAPITGATGFRRDHLRILQHGDPHPRGPAGHPPVHRPGWAAITALGSEIDDRLAAGDVRLTMGGEPTSSRSTIRSIRNGPQMPTDRTRGSASQR